MTTKLRLFAIKRNDTAELAVKDGPGPVYFTDKKPAKAYRDMLNAALPKGVAYYWHVTYGPDHRKHNQ